MENLVLTQLSVSEIRTIISEAVESVFLKHHALAAKEEDKDIIFSLLEACKFLRLARPTLYRYTSQNIIPHLKRGKKLFFVKADLLQWLKDGKKSSVAEMAKKENFFMLNTRKRTL